MHFSLADECKIFLAIGCDWQRSLEPSQLFFQLTVLHFNDDKGVRIGGTKVPTDVEVERVQGKWGGDSCISNTISERKEKGCKGADLKVTGQWDLNVGRRDKIYECPVKDS